MAKGRILLVAGQPGARIGVRAYLERCGHDVREADTCGAAIAQVKLEHPDVMLIELALHDGRAVDVLRALRSETTDVPAIVLTGDGSIEFAATVMKEGAEHVVATPVDLELLSLIIDRALDRQQHRRVADAARPRPSAASADDLIVGRSPAVRALVRDAASIAASDTPVLIEGEAGTGKRVLARRLHEAGARAREAFVDVGCAALSRDLLEPELFGHEQGAGADARRGLLEAAHRGTMFLDEIGDIDLAVQPKLLKAIDEKRFRRVGGTTDRSIDVRFIASTTRNLAQLAGAGTFREDLFYRMNTLVLRLPPLRERKDDIPLLAGRIVQQLARDRHRPAPQIDPEAEEALKAYAWPGNLRELRNVLERAVMLARTAVVGRVDLRLHEHPLPAAERAPLGSITLKDLEWQHIDRVLEEEGGNVPRAARRLGVPRSTMYQRLKLRQLRQTA